MFYFEVSLNNTWIDETLWERTEDDDDVKGGKIGMPKKFRSVHEIKSRAARNIACTWTLTWEGERGSCSGQRNFESWDCYSQEIESICKLSFPLGTMLFCTIFLFKVDVRIYNGGFWKYSSSDAPDMTKPFLSFVNLIS